MISLFDNTPPLHHSTAALQVQRRGV